MFRKMKFLLAFAALSICLCLMSSTYSRYVADSTSNVDVLFAKWQILVNNTDITDGTDSSITFVPIMEENENVANNVIAPSSKGYFDINIDPSNAEVSFKYDITLSVLNENTPDIKITSYAIVPNDYVEGNPLETVFIENGVISSNLLFDSTTPGFKFNEFTIRIYFEWYEGENELMDDDMDTQIGIDAANGINPNFTMNANIAFEQLLN